MCKQRGCDPGSALAPCTATLGYRTPDRSICRTPNRSWTKELSSFRSVLDRTRLSPITHTITLTCQLSSCVVSTRTETPLDSFADALIVRGVGAQQAEIAGQHHVAVGHRQMRLRTTLNQHPTAWTGYGE